MPATYSNHHEPDRHTDDMQDIITSVPSWILRWGTTLFFGLLVLAISLAAMIRYPDIVTAQLKIDSPNSPKPTVAKISGKLVKLLATENEPVSAGQPLAYLESTANHNKVLALLIKLKNLQQQVLQNRPFNSLLFNETDNTQFGELQSAYQTFFQACISYKAAINDGFLVKKKTFLQKDLSLLSNQQQQLKAANTVQQKDLNIAAVEFAMHKKLEEEKVETPAELRQQESKYLAKKNILYQTESAIITGDNNYAAKQSEILELDNQIQQEKEKFSQALNSMISMAEDWKSKYVLTASQSGKLSYAGIVQENQVLLPNQEVFYVNPGNEAFFGEMAIAQSNMGKVQEGQKVLVKLKSYPFEEYGIIRGKIEYIAEVPYQDSVFMSKVTFKIKNSSDLKKPIHLKQGMTANAEIITQDATVLQRLSRVFLKIAGNQ